VSGREVDTRRVDLLAIALKREQEGTQALVELLERDGLQVHYAPAEGIVGVTHADASIDRFRAIRDDSRLLEAVQRVGWGRRLEDEQCIRELSLELDGAREMVAILEDRGWQINDDAQRGLIVARDPNGVTISIWFDAAAEELLERARAHSKSPDATVADAVTALTARADPGSVDDEEQATDTAWNDIQDISDAQPRSPNEAFDRLIAGQRDRNRWLVLDALRTTRSSTHREIADRTTLQQATVLTQVEELIAEGLVVRLDAGLHQHRPRSRAPEYALNPSSGYAVALSMGRTHIRGALADLALGVHANRSVIAQFGPLEFPVETDGRAALAAALDQIKDLLTRVPRERVVGVAIGLPAPIDRALGGVVTGWLHGWERLRAAEEITRELRLPVEIENDANLAAIGELVFGAGRNHRDLVYVKAASGIGAGIVFDGQLRRGETGIAGEFGHTIVDKNGPQCYCGNRGCLERIAGGAALLDSLGEEYERVTLDAFVERAKSGDQECRALLDSAAREIGFALVNLRNIADVSCIVLGGTLSRAGPLFSTPISDLLGEHSLWPSTRRAYVVAGELGDDAAVYGGLELVLRSRSETFASRIRAVLRAP
jgi:predicted NBD/HSP70 family sugar kinase